jgi:hypothetical protein
MLGKRCSHSDYAYVESDDGEAGNSLYEKAFAVN